MESLFAVKSTVFSLGVLLLEIISGKNNSKSYIVEHGQGLLIYAWNFWCESIGFELMDPLIENSCVHNAMWQCLYISLLFLQEDAAGRPTMSNVVHMLASDTMTLPSPTRPAFSVKDCRTICWGTISYSYLFGGLVAREWGFLLENALSIMH